MGPFILNALAILIALVLLFGIWIGVHLLARRRMGDRKLGCQGPSYDAAGNSICCKTGLECDRDKDKARPAEAVHKV